MTLQMSDKVRQTVYVAMGLVYAAAVACAQTNVLPAQYAHLLGAVMLVLGAMMKEFSPKDGAQ